MRITGYNIVESQERYQPHGFETSIIYELTFNDGTTRRLEGHGNSYKDSGGVWHVKYRLKLPVNGSYIAREYEAHPTENNKFFVRGRTDTSKGISSIFVGDLSIKDEDMLAEGWRELSIDNFMRRYLVGREI